MLTHVSTLNYLLNVRFFGNYYTIEKVFPRITKDHATAKFFHSERFALYGIIYVFYTPIYAFVVDKTRLCKTCINIWHVIITNQFIIINIINLVSPWSIYVRSYSPWYLWLGAATTHISTYLHGANLRKQFHINNSSIIVQHYFSLPVMHIIFILTE